MSGRRLLLVGMMGSGKSTVAALAGARLGWPVVDTDSLVEAEVGTSVAEVFARQGEAEFRARESRAIAQLANGPEPAVVSVGGGAVLSAANRSLLRRAGTVVWLRARPETLAERVGDGTGRPLLAGTPREAIERLVAEREPLYQEVADMVVDVDGLSPEQVVDKVVVEKVCERSK
ncbi:MAG: shikimate kinase [Acidimicrobiales bacterium]